MFTVHIHGYFGWFFKFVASSLPPYVLGSVLLAELGSSVCRDFFVPEFWKTTVRCELKIKSECMTMEVHFRIHVSFPMTTKYQYTLLSLLNKISNFQRMFLLYAVSLYSIQHSMQVTPIHFAYSRHYLCASYVYLLK